jgi:hypothetical protein
MTIGPYVAFDGRTLTLYDKNEKQIGSWPAICGLPSLQGLQNFGPISEGAYLESRWALPQVDWYGAS